MNEAKMMTIDEIVVPSMPSECALGPVGTAEAILAPGEVIEVKKLPKVGTDFDLPGGRDVFVNARLSRAGAGKYSLQVANGYRLCKTAQKALSLLAPGSTVASELSVNPDHVPSGVLVLQ